MNFKRLLTTPIGIAFISILLGVGLATLFRKVCTDKNCIVFNGPIIDTISEKTYKYGEKCYKYNIEPAPCDSNKKIIDFASSTDENGKINEINLFGK